MSIIELITYAVDFSITEDEILADLSYGAGFDRG
jgi:hypothetical protein